MGKMELEPPKRRKQEEEEERREGSTLASCQESCEFLQWEVEMLCRLDSGLV
jgi:hypothetical protein